MHVAGCVGATRPGVGESDWGCWDCAAASRMGCPNGLAIGVGAGRQSHTHTHPSTNRNDKVTMATHQNREMCRWKKGGRTSGRETGEVRVRTQEVQPRRIVGQAESPWKKKEQHMVEEIKEVPQNI